MEWNQAPPPKEPLTVEEIKDMVRLMFRAKLGPFMGFLCDIWLAPTIPPEKLATAQASFVNLVKGEEPIAFSESRGLFLKSKGKYGLLVTTHGLHWRVSAQGTMGDPMHVIYAELDPNTVNYKKGFINNKLYFGSQYIEPSPECCLNIERGEAEYYDGRTIRYAIVESLLDFIRFAAREWREESLTQEEEKVLLHQIAREQIAQQNLRKD